MYEKIYYNSFGDNMQFEITPTTLEEYESKNQSVLLLDMRTKREFHQFHIPDAYSLPILTDEEHKIVGTLYVNGAHEEAKCRAVDYAAKKLPAYVRQVVAFTHEYDHVVLYCSRGGMRSHIFYQLLRSLGYPVERLQGGYKAYRKHVLSALEELTTQKDFIVLHGKTGVGKTEILDKLLLAGKDVVDLEGLANHRGSSFGAVGKGEQPSQKMFESLLYDALRHCSHTIYTEGESSRIGNILIPHFLYEKMRHGRRIVIEDNLSNRVRRIAQDYLQCEKEELLISLNKLSRYLSEKNYQTYRQAILEDRYKEVIEDLMVRYYDSHYAVAYTKEDMHFSHEDNIVEQILAWEKMSS